MISAHYREARKAMLGGAADVPPSPPRVPLARAASPMISAHYKAARKAMESGSPAPSLESALTRAQKAMTALQPSPAFVAAAMKDQRVAKAWRPPGQKQSVWDGFARQYKAAGYRVTPLGSADGGHVLYAFHHPRMDAALGWGATPT
jgi:hypothetical protein